MSENEKENQRPSIVVPLDDLDKVSDDDIHKVDALAQELATIMPSATIIAIIAILILTFTHQHIF